MHPAMAYKSSAFSYADIVVGYKNNNYALL